MPAGLRSGAARTRQGCEMQIQHMMRDGGAWRRVTDCKECVRVLRREPATAAIAHI